MSDTVFLLLDDREEAERAASALEAAGFEVASADAGTWEPPSDGPPFLVLLDGALPEGRAFRLAHELRQGSLSDVPVAWLGGPEDELAALSVGATLFLGPPLDADELVALAKALAESSEGRRKLAEGLRRLREAEFDEGLEELATAGPGLLGAWGRYHAGVARLESGDPQGAAEELHALLEDSPDFWRAHVQLARLYRGAGFDWEAKEHLRQARELAHSLGEESVSESRPIPDFAPAAWPFGASGEAVPVPDGQEVELVVESDAAQAQDDDLQEPPAEAGEANERPLVLLADDSELALAMIGDHLESAGYRVVTAADGKEAVERAREQRPDLVVLDGLMPGMNGFEACRQIKALEEGGGPPPVILLSAIYTKQRQRTEAMSVYGADDLIPKSTDDSALLEAARRLCRRA